MTAVVSLKNVVKRYTRGKQQVEVLHGLDLHVESGEFLALIAVARVVRTDFPSR